MSAPNSLILPMRRKQELSAAHPERYQTLRTVAENLSLRNVDAATCELMNEAVTRLVMLAYEVDVFGFCNIDGVTGKLLIPAPWGRNGYARWGLRPSEANILREILFAWQEKGGALLTYDRGRRAWFVDLRSYPQVHIAKGWLRGHQISVKEYRAARAKRVGNA